MDVLSIEIANRVDLQGLEVDLQNRQGQKGQAGAARMLYLCQADFYCAGMADIMADYESPAPSRRRIPEFF